MAQRMPRLLAVASGGGHWIQLLRLRDAFAGFETAYVSMFENYADAVPGARLYTIPDASRFDKLSFVKVGLKALWIMAKERPRAIVTTGSAPMLSFILLGRLIGARTLWIDSIANAERMSSSGRLARKLAHRTVSQWPEVAAAEGVECWGSVL
jgi:UDP-N-acetylglucosamine:LPS N-acetylglucosamine transferase